MTTRKHAATLLVLMAAALTGLANAQTSIMVKAQVPFDFVVNGKTIPAGECLVQSLNNALTVLLISSGKQQGLVLPLDGESRKASTMTALVFHRYGDRHFLAAIKRAGKIGYELPSTRLEEELRAQNIAEEDLTLLAFSK